MVLKNWSLTSRASAYTPPELMYFNLQGDVYGHPRFEDGSPVITSKIMEINDKGDHKEAITYSGSVYELYKDYVNPMAEREHPNYYERLKLEVID